MHAGICICLFPSLVQRKLSLRGTWGEKNKCDDSFGFHIFKTICFLELLTHLWCVSTYMWKIIGKALINPAKLIPEIQARRTYVDEKVVEQQTFWVSLITSPEELVPLLALELRWGNGSPGDEWSNQLQSAVAGIWTRSRPAFKAFPASQRGKSEEKQHHKLWGKHGAGL